MFYVVRLGDTRRVKKFGHLARAFVACIRPHGRRHLQISERVFAQPAARIGWHQFWNPRALDLFDARDSLAVSRDGVELVASAACRWVCIRYVYLAGAEMSAMSKILISSQ